MPSKGSLSQNLKLIKKDSFKKEDIDWVTNEIWVFFGISGCLSLPYMIFFVGGIQIGGPLVYYMYYRMIPKI